MKAFVIRRQARREGCKPSYLVIVSCLRIGIFPIGYRRGKPELVQSQDAKGDKSCCQHRQVSQPVLQEDQTKYLMLSTLASIFLVPRHSYRVDDHEEQLISLPLSTFLNHHTRFDVHEVAVKSNLSLGSRPGKQNTLSHRRQHFRRQNRETYGAVCIGDIISSNLPQPSNKTYI